MRTSQSTSVPVYGAHEPAAATPVIFDSPHSGSEFPADFRPAASRRDIDTTWDAYVDELCAGVIDTGAGLLTARFPRAYIDANRAADDIDPELLATVWPTPVELSDHGRRGMGLIRRFVSPRIPMYDRLLTVSEVAARIDNYYKPYRAALGGMVKAVSARHGAVWHFNCHSMKARGVPTNGAPGAPRPDFSIGDRDGTSAPPKLTAWVAQFFEQRGYHVRTNSPYRGADIVRSVGAPARRRYSIQIEINRSLYMDEATWERGANFGRIRDTLSDFAKAVATLAAAATRAQAGG